MMFYVYFEKYECLMLFRSTQRVSVGYWDVQLYQDVWFFK